jgi:hypothetical protein
MKLSMARGSTMNSAMINGFSDELQQIHKVANTATDVLSGTAAKSRLNYAAARKLSTDVPLKAAVEKAKLPALTRRVGGPASWGR